MAEGVNLVRNGVFGDRQIALAVLAESHAADYRVDGMCVYVPLEQSYLAIRTLGASGAAEWAGEVAELGGDQSRAVSPGGRLVPTGILDALRSSPPVGGGHDIPEATPRVR